MGQLKCIVLGFAIAATAVAAPELSRRDWQEKLTPHFDPSPSSQVKFSQYKLQNFKYGDDINKLSGEIVVTPPQGECFDIEIRKDMPDQRICKSDALKFTFRDLDPYGRLKVLVKSKQNPFGSELTWQTPYRVAVTISWMTDPGAAPEKWLVSNCHAIHDEKGRRIELSILGQKPWIIHFPEKDKLLPQPPAPPNLRIVQDDRFQGIMAMAERRRVQKEAEAQIKEGETAGVMISGQSDGPEERKVWSLPMRDSYEMPADNFQPAGHVPSGGQGVCWYRYKGSEQDPDVGRIECKSADKFRSVYIPLNCLADIKIDR